jgi:acyl-CoA synthetase (NDP forming)
MASFIGGQAVKEAKDLLCHAGVPTFNYPEVAVRSFKKLVTYKTSLKKQRLYHILSNKNKSIIRSIDYLYSLALLEKYKIKTILTFRYEKTKAKNYQYPVVLKAVGPDFLHKTDKQAVIVNLNSVQELQIAADRIMKQQQGAFMNPDNYLVVQAMASGGQEIIMGFKRDLSFGVTMMIGWGGVYAEVLKEIKLATSDLNLKEARNLIKNLKIYPILNGIRGRQKYDIENLALALVNLAKLANDHPEIKEADINPLFVFKKGVAAADVRIII